MNMRQAALVSAAILCAIAMPLAATQMTGAAPRPAGIAAAPSTGAKPQRIMSTNMCTDLLLLMLVPKERIASITYLVHEPVSVLMPGADAGVAINHGTAEEAVRQQPDLILGSPWTTPTLRRLAARVGAPVAEVDSANSFDDIRRVTRQVGALVGEPERAERLITEMDRELARLAATRPERPLRVVAWSGSGNSVPGMGTLTHEIMQLAGAHNIAASLPGTSYSSFGLEELLAARPDAILRGAGQYEAPSLHDSASEHPVIRAAFRGRRIAYPEALYTCGLPQSAQAVGQLRAALARVPAGGVPW